MEIALLMERNLLGAVAAHDGFDSSHVTLVAFDDDAELFCRESRAVVLVERRG